MLKLYDLEELKQTSRSGPNYDLFEVRWFRPSDYVFRTKSLYKVKKGEEMRMDLVSFSIYNKVDHLDFLCFLNGISNPLNIQEGQLIIYVTEAQIDDFKKPPASDTVQQAVAKANRGTKPDPARQDYLDNNLSLPPNLLEIPTEQVQRGENSIRLGGF